MKSLKAGRGMGMFVGNRGSLYDRDNTRSSLHLSVVALGCLDQGDERDDGQGCYLSWLGLRPGMDPAIKVG
jgi:hypothetical protein